MVRQTQLVFLRLTPAIKEQNRIELGDKYKLNICKTIVKVDN